MPIFFCVVVLYHIAFFPIDPSMKHYGARALPTQAKDGVILQSQQFLYEFKCDQPKCTWTQMPQQLTVPASGDILEQRPWSLIF